MWWFVFDTSLLTAGYVASVFSWPTVRVWIIGAAAEAVRLRNRAAELEAQIRKL